VYKNKEIKTMAAVKRGKVSKSNEGIPVPTGKPVVVKSMGAGQGFHFTSGRKEVNTGFYIKTNSPNNKAMNLNTYGIIQFDKDDEAVPVNFSLLMKQH
jgi:hypothetical protein